MAYDVIGDKMRYSELIQKQVCDVETGRILGHVNDLLILPCEYAIKELYVSGNVSCIQRWFPWFFPEEELVIRICDVVQIGEDVILVRISNIT